MAGRDPRKVIADPRADWELRIAGTDRAHWDRGVIVAEPQAVQEIRTARADQQADRKRGNDRAV